MDWKKAYKEASSELVDLRRLVDRKMKAARELQAKLEIVCADRAALRRVLMKYGKNGMCGATIFTKLESAERFIELKMVEPGEVILCDQCTVMRKGKDTYHVQLKRT